MDKRWSKTELTHLKRNADKQTPEELSQRFHTDAETVRAKLQELGLLATGAPSPETDKALELYGQAVPLAHEKQWQKAADLFEQVIEHSDGRQLTDRARQYLTICNRYLSAPVEVDDPYLQAVIAKNKGEITEALEICASRGDAGDERYLYLQASLEALNGDAEAAVENLRSAIEAEPKNRIHAFHDPDFGGLAEVEEFQQLVAQS